MNGNQVKFPVLEVEARIGGSTLWVHNAVGSTALRLKCTGIITVDEACNNTVPHSDILVEGNIVLCMPKSPAPSVLSAVSNEALDRAIQLLTNPAMYTADNRHAVLQALQFSRMPL